MHTDMTRVNAIWQHPLYQQNLKDLILPVMVLNEIPVTALRIWLPARS